MFAASAAPKIGASTLIACVLTTFACRRESVSVEPVRVAAAADLSDAFDELARQFEAKTRQHVALSFGATGLLATQLEQGAPFDLFAAANVAAVDGAVAAGACDAATRALYARGRIALFWREPALVPAPSSLADLADARFRRIATANPEHAPYGIAAREALTRAGILSAVGPRLVYAENVRQALQMAESGNAEVAIVAHSLVLSSKLGHSLDVDPSLHRPIDQELVVCRHGKNQNGAREFAAFVRSREGRATMSRFGFALPDAAP